MVKPDAVQRGLVGAIVSRLEEAQLEISRMRFGTPSPRLMREFYAEHAQKPHFRRLIDYMTSGPMCFIEMTGGNAVARVRQLAGDTDPANAAPGTIRGDLAIDLPRNSIHASDSPEAAEYEAALIFDSDEIMPGTSHPE